MKKQYLPFIVIIASVLLMFFNIITSEVYDKGFWMRILSSILLIVAMFFTLYSFKNDNKNE